MRVPSADADGALTSGPPISPAIRSAPIHSSPRSGSAPPIPPSAAPARVSISSRGHRIRPEIARRRWRSSRRRSARGPSPPRTSGSWRRRSARRSPSPWTSGSLPATERVKVAQEVRPRSRLPATEGVKGAQEIRPRFVWGRRPRANGGRRRPRPRGRYGYFKYAPVISRGRFPAPAKPPVAAPRLDQFPLIPINTSPPTGNPAIDKELQRIAFAYGSIAQIRLMICARADLMMTWGVHRVETQTIWKKHDNLIKAVEALRENVFREYGIEAPPVPERFYLKF